MSKSKAQNSKKYQIRNSKKRFRFCVLNFEIRVLSLQIFYERESV